jgi:hypothetical protein
MSFNRDREVPKWLAEIVLPNPDSLDNLEFPLNHVLERSLYYPASGFDGRPVQFLAGFVHSFIYVDYGLEEKQLDCELIAKGFLGYRIAGRKRLIEADLVPSGWTPTIHERFTGEITRMSEEYRRRPFAVWFVFERLPEFDKGHGPSRFSFVYICGDGVAAYEALFLTRGIAPLVLAIIQPGHGFGGNYTDFTNPDGLLAEMVLRTNGRDIPEYLVCGGKGMDYNRAFWPSDYPTLVEYFQRDNGNGLWQHRSHN